jgi:ankyrin repeat protein
MDHPDPTHRLKWSFTAFATTQFQKAQRQQVFTQAILELGDVNKVVRAICWEGTVLYLASYFSQYDKVKWLLEQRGIDVNRGDVDGISPLMSASMVSTDLSAVAASVDVVKALIDAGADVDRQDHKGRTALMEASGRGCTEIVSQLLKAGARVNLANHSGWTALKIASDRRHGHVVDMLLGHRALPGTGTKRTHLYGILPRLHAFLVLSSSSRFPYTLTEDDVGDDKVLSKRDMYGRTALHYAALTGNLDAYAALHGAMTTIGVDTEVTDGGGYTASDHLVCMCYVCPLSAR